MSTKMNEIMAVAQKELPQLKAIISLNAPNSDAETLAKQELEHLGMIGINTPAIFDCIPATIVMAIKTVLKQNLTLDPHAGLVYVKTRSVKVNDQWMKALEIQPSANGLISIARQCGRIFDIERPEVIKDADGKVIGVKCKYLVPSYDESGKKCMKWREVEFDESDFYRWRRASHNENGRNKQDANAEKLNYANPTYTNWKGGIDPEFARAKAIRHGLKKLGTNQNESRAAAIVNVPVKNVVDQDADMMAAGDEQGPVEYIQHEEVSTAVNPAPSINIPSPNEL